MMLMYDAGRWWSCMILNYDDDDDDDNDNDDISMQWSGGPIHRAAADQHIPVLQRDDDIEAEWRSKSDEEPIRRVEDQGDAH